MKCIELSIKELREKSVELAKQIEKDFQPDIVVFIAKGSYLIGEEVSNYFDVPLVEVFAVREGNALKELLSPILKLIPKGMKNYLRKREINSGVHNKNSERKVYFEKGEEKLETAQRILIIDDSVDTGNTAKQVYKYIENSFKNKTIKFGSLNYIEGSQEVFEVDFNLFKNHIMIGPWSKDSRYYKEFLKRYKLAKEEGAI